MRQRASHVLHEHGVIVRILGDEFLVRTLEVGNTGLDAQFSMISMRSSIQKNRS
jgi:hypothetical protein